MPALPYFVSTIFLVFFLNVFPVAAAGFVDNRNGTVTDSNSGLVWQKGDSFHTLQKGLNWYEALEYITRKNSEKFADHDDWRLPTLKELNQLWVAAGKIKSKDESIKIQSFYFFLNIFWKTIHWNFYFILI